MMFLQLKVDFIPYDITAMWDLKYGTNEPTYKTETDSQIWRTDLWLPRAERGSSGTDREFGVSWCKLFHLDWLSSEVLLYCTGNCVRSLGIRHYRDDMRKRRYMHGQLQKLARHCKSATRTLV